MKVIFACIHNAGRSQMAAAFFNQMADTSKAQAISAETPIQPNLGTSKVKGVKGR
jgi:protein-tyrosine-phosphatase